MEAVTFTQCFTAFSPRLVDVYECEGSGHGCSQHCTNNDGSYVCGCSDGYRLGEDGKTCIGAYE